jgi:hypothetical protein
VSRHGRAITRRDRPSLRLAGVIALLSAGLEAADCNGNGEDDAREIAAGSAPDCNSNGVPDACDLEAPGFEFSPVGQIEDPGFLLDRLADLNGDGLDDLLGIAASERRSVGAYFRDGDGTFPAAMETLWTFALGGLILHAGDLDGDDDADILLSEQSSILLLENDGEGGLTPVDGFPLELNEGSRSGVATDIDGDGDLDVAVSAIRLHLLVNEGELAFRPMQPIAGVEGSGQAAAADLDRDGDTDIILVYDHADGISVLRNDGAGGFLEIDRYSSGGEMGSGKVLLSDVDGDGWQEVVTRHATLRDVSLFYNDGRGGLLPPLHFPAIGHVSDLEVADLDVDGAPDLIAADYKEGMIRALLNSSGTFAEVFAMPLESTYGLLALDLDRDGRTDIVTGSLDAVVQSAVFRFFTNEARTRSLDCDGSNVPDECEVSTGAAGDCNANGVPDACEIERGEEMDCNANGIPDGCDTAPPAVLLVGPGLTNVGYYDTGITAADLDGDGDADLAVTSGFDEDVSVLRNNGDGSLRSRARFGVRGRPAGVLAADLDGDEDADLVVPGEDLVNVLLNAGNGLFAPARSLPAGSMPLSAAIADIDADGRPDIIAANFDSDDLSALRSGGGGTFAEMARIPTVPRPRAITSGDLDADGDLDVAICSETVNTLAFHLANPGGQIEDALLFEVPVLPSALATGDVDGDGDVDVAVTQGGNLLLLLASGATIAAEQEYIPQLAARQLLLSDIDGDRDLDIIAGTRVARRSNDEYVFEDAYLRGSIAAGDVDGDGLVDLVGVEQQVLSVHLQLAGGGFVPWGEALAGDTSAHAAAADLDGDTDLDLVVVTDRLQLLMNDAAGRFIAGPTLETDPIPVATVCGDLDGDGDQDIAAVHSSSPRLTIFFNLGDGRFPLLPDARVEAGTQQLALADVEGDGDLDLLASARAPDLPGPALAVSRNDGGGAFDPPEFHSTGGSTGPLAAADFDRDGSVDVVTDGANELNLLRNTGNGNFELPVTIGSATSVRHIVTGDIDLDGSEDVAAAAREAIFVAFNDGGAAFPRTRAIPTGNLEGGALALPDLNLDGALDLAVSRARDRDIRLFLNLGTREFSEMPAPSIQGVPAYVLGADMDGDRRDDLVLLKTLPGTAVAFLNRTFAGGSPDCNANGLPDACDLEDGDCDANGLLDACELSPRFALDDPLAFLDGVPRGGLAAGDWDGDGWTDLAATMDASPGIEQVLVLRNDGNGGGFAAAPYVLEAPAGDLRALDLDGDGDLDIAAGTSLPGTLLVNDGSGSFDAAPFMLVSSAAWTAADWNGDGRLDLGLTTGLGIGAVWIFFQTGSLEFSQGPSFFGVVPRAVAGAALNKDSRLDLLAIDAQARMLLVALQGEGGSFTDRRLPLEGMPLDLVAGDIDADGDTDVVMALAGVTILENDGEGNLGPVRNLPVSALETTSPTVEGIFLEDIDGDSSMDIVGSAHGAVYVFRNAGRGAFEPARRFLGLAPRLAFLDLDRDGDLDVVGAGRRDPLAVVPRVLHLMTNDRTPPSRRDDNSNGLIDECESLPFHRGDANADGVLDIVDPIFLLLHLFSEEKVPPCLEAADGTDDGRINISDPIRLLDYLFLGTSSAPPAPGPPPAPCGLDPEGDGVFLGCGSFDSC